MLLLSSNVLLDDKQVAKFICIGVSLRSNVSMLCHDNYQVSAIKVDKIVRRPSYLF